MKTLILILKRWRQKKRIKHIKSDLEDMSWHMQFEDLSASEIKGINKRIAALRLWLRIEEGFFEGMKTLILLLLPLIAFSQEPRKQHVTPAYWDALHVGEYPANEFTFLGVVDGGTTFQAKTFNFEPGAEVNNSTFIVGPGCTIEDALVDTSIFRIEADTTYEWPGEMNDYIRGRVIPSHEVYQWFQSESDPANENSSWGLASGASYFPDVAKLYCIYNYRATAWIDGTLYVSNIIQRSCEYVWNPRP